MTKSLKEKYKEFLTGFGIMLPESEIDRRVNLEVGSVGLPRVYEMTPTRQQAIDAYTITYNDFGYPISENIKYLHESQIWDYALRNVNVEINKRFGKQLACVSDVIRRKHVKDALTALFDQRIYINKEQVEKLIVAAADNEEIFEVYLSFGGDKTMFDPLVLYEDDEYLEDYYENYEDEESDPEEDFEEVK